ncbi:MAG: hypothetical protein HYY95_03535, partial [Candidatus Rokubacteria bacterium]|nr:hypothetical protein [Candidatus Rokubacteria bacterium]
MLVAGSAVEIVVHLRTTPQVPGNIAIAMLSVSRAAIPDTPIVPEKVGTAVPELTVRLATTTSQR